MKKIETIRQLQLVSIYVYKQLRSFCKSNDLNVYLLGGTLIGAVRDKGFIRWDDDIDVCMSRDDYDKMLRLSGGRISDDCSIVDPETDKSFKGYISVAVFNNSKSISKQYREIEESRIGVSIFVYDGVPNNSILRKLYFKHMYILRAQHALCRADFNHVSSKLAKIVGPFFSIFYSTKKVYHYKNKILKLQKKYPYSSSDLVSPNTDTNAWLEVFPKNSFEKSVRVQFEGIECDAFSHYDAHLTQYYGDYMTPPPNNEREPKHSFDAWVDDNFVYEENAI